MPLGRAATGGRGRFDPAGILRRGRHRGDSRRAAERGTGSSALGAQGCPANQGGQPPGREGPRAPTGQTAADRHGPRRAGGHGASSSQDPRRPPHHVPQQERHRATVPRPRTGWRRGHHPRGAHSWDEGHRGQRRPGRLEDGCYTARADARDGAARHRARHAAHDSAARAAGRWTRRHPPAAARQHRGVLRARYLGQQLEGR